MCGILLFYGPQAKKRLESNIFRLKHRGPDETKTYHNGLLSLGFNRLAINDKSSSGRQPFKYNNYISVINGEIYNHSKLREQYNISIEGKCDTHIILPIFELLGDEIISVLDGFYSGLIFNTKSYELFCLRDYIGKKPLFIGKSITEIFITSELKAIKTIDSFEMLPKGISRIELELNRMKVIPIRKHCFDEIHDNTVSLKKLLINAVIKRLPDKTEPVGVFLSGGLDSSIIASIVAAHRKDAIYYTLETKNSPDSFYVKQLEKYLGLKTVKYIEYLNDETLMNLIKRVVYTTESINPSIVSNGLCTYLLAESAHKDGLKVVLSGEGADEIFCGYHMFQEQDDWKHIRQRLISDMCFTELRRIDQTCMAHSIENRCPFLDKSIYSFASCLTYNDFFCIKEDHMENKYILRKTAEQFLPQEIVRRKKISFDVGSGIRALVVNSLTKGQKKEKEVLRSIWKQFYKGDSNIQYYHSYPVFDEAIDKRGVTHK